MPSLEVAVTQEDIDGWVREDWDATDPLKIAVERAFAPANAILRLDRIGPLPKPDGRVWACLIEVLADNGDVTFVGLMPKEAEATYETLDLTGKLEPFTFTVEPIDLERLLAGTDTNPKAKGTTY